MALTDLEHQVLGDIRHHHGLGSHNRHAIDDTGLFQHFHREIKYALSLEHFYILLHRIVLFDIFLNHALQVLRVVEERANSLQDILRLIEEFFALTTSLGLDTTDTRCHRTLRDNLEEADLTRSLSVDTTTELTRRAEADHTNLVAILLAEKGDGTNLLCLLEGQVAILLERNIRTNHLIDHTFHLTDLFVSHFLEV